MVRSRGLDSTVTAAAESTNPLQWLDNNCKRGPWVYSAVVVRPLPLVLTFIVVLLVWAIRKQSVSITVDH